MRPILSVLLSFAMTIPLFCFNAHAKTIFVPANFPTIQQAIDASNNNDVIIVSPGTYDEDQILYKGKAVVVKSALGPESTIIDGQVRFKSGEKNDSVIDGFTITNAHSGVYCLSGSSPFIKNNIITQNLEGGGIVCKNNSNPLIMNNIITKNESNHSSFGGGITCRYSEPTIQNNIISHNISNNWFGGGIGCYKSKLKISHNIIFNNQAGRGGGIDCESSLAEITSNLIYNNHAVLGGAVRSAFASEATIMTSNTIVNNSATHQGGAIYAASPMVVTNTILWNDTAPIGSEVYILSGPFEISFSNVKNGLASVDCDGKLIWGSCMHEVNPKFCDSAAGDFHLLIDSPCRSKGFSSAPGMQVTDFEGDPIPSFGQPDIGADQYHPHLYYTGDPTPGGEVTLKLMTTDIKGPVILWVGSGVLENPIHIPNYGDWHLTLPLVFSLPLGAGPPASGLIELDYRFPLGFPVPSDLPMQAFMANMLSNLSVVKLR